VAPRDTGNPDHCGRRTIRTGTDIDPRSGPMRHRTLLISAALAATVAAVPLMPTPANATPDGLAVLPANVYAKDGCTVTAHAPAFVSIASNGQKRVRFKMTFTCDGNRSISAKQNGYDSDVGENSATDLLLTKNYGPYAVPGAGGSGTWAWDLLVDHWDGVADPVVELYHRISFQVTGGGIVGAWSPWVYSPQVDFVV
jgi:hypothetical protein